VDQKPRRTGSVEHCGMIEVDGDVTPRSCYAVGDVD
jgi:hypothetical protein